MTSDEIRRKFLDFFVSKGHKEIASDTVVPKDDPTVLFTTAGMQQFKRQFLGQMNDYRRAASSQKCLRTDDLNKIGKTPVHHTFFEMLGNFSFADYFKSEAIGWAWEFFTKELKIPKDKLWVSVYEEDGEAYDIWKKIIDKKRILRLGDKDNFWPAEAKTKGPNGPCGPCSEIFFDFGIDPKHPCKSKNCDPTCNCGRFAEVWNLVFTQFNRKEDGTLEPLPGKNIDTGMGLERLAAVIQGKRNNYETDLFEPIISQLEELFEKKCCTLEHSEKCIIADHLRAIVFGICDGVMPSNEGRGYVIKKLIVDSCDIGLKKGIKEPFICRFVPTVADVMHQPYPDVARKQSDISVIVQKVEEAYIKLRKERMPELVDTLEILDKTSKTFYKELGDIIFKYRDTFGLTLHTIRDTTLSAKINSNEWNKAINYYEIAMDHQKEKSRAASKMTGDVFAGAEMNLANLPKTKFTGYDHTDGTGKILRMFGSGNKEISQAKEGESVIIILNETPFYAESGGQVGDIGTIASENCIIEIRDTQKTADVFCHYATVKKGTIKTGDSVKAKIDSDRRLAIMRNHTATHLLQSALRQVLGTHVQQQGSLVAENRLRFDFTHPKAVSSDEIGKIDSLVNGYIQANDRIEKYILPIEEAKKRGALAFFAEKYGETVRVVEIDGYSKEFCGGTHLKNTKEIENFTITSEGAVAQGIRRIEARTGEKALEFIQKRKKREAANKESEAKRLKESEENKEKNRKFLEDFKSTRLPQITKSATVVADAAFVTCELPDASVAQLKQAYDLIKQQIPSVAVCVGSGSTIVIGVSGDSAQKKINANDVVKNDINPILGGKGGGSPQLAQAVGNDASKLLLAIEKAGKVFKEKLR